MTTKAEADIVLYALGGGMGHFVRAASIADAICFASAQRPTILTSPGFTHLFKSDGYDVHTIKSPDNPSFYRTKILETLDKLRPRTLVVDALPMGLMGELREYLPKFRGKKVLVARLLRKDYRRHMSVDDFVRQHYDLVIRCEQLPRKFLSHPQSITVPPILAADPSDLPDRKAARAMLGAADGRFVIIAVGTDPPEQTDAFFALVDRIVKRCGSRKVELRFASPYGEPSPASVHTRYFPLMRLLNGADLVIGHAGYHLYHECAAVGVPALLFPRPRLYDDQEARAKKKRGRIETYEGPEELEAGIRRHISDEKQFAAPRRKRTKCGAQEAAKAILDTCSQNRY